MHGRTVKEMYWSEEHCRLDRAGGGGHADTGGGERECLFRAIGGGGLTHHGREGIDDRAQGDPQSR